MYGYVVEPMDRAVTAVGVEIADARALQLLGLTEEGEEAYSPVDERVRQTGPVEVSGSAHVVLPTVRCRRQAVCPARAVAADARRSNRTTWSTLVALTALLFDNVMLRCPVVAVIIA